jgi:hypothetical protein
MSSYYGRSADNISNVIKLDNITFNGGTTYALTQNGVAFVPNNSSSILISIDGVVEQSNFTVNSSNIVFNFSPTSSNTCNWILHIGVGVAYVPAASSITKDKTDFVSNSSSSGITSKGDGGSVDGSISLNCSQNTHHTKISSSSHSSYAGNLNFVLPSSHGSNGQFMKTDGSGNLSFADAPSGGLVPVRQSSGSSNTTNVIVNGWISDTYENYVMDYYFNVATNNEAISMTLYDSSGNISSGNNYDWTHIGSQASDGAKLELYNSGQNAFRLCHGANNDSARVSVTGRLIWLHPRASGKRTTILHHQRQLNNSAVTQTFIGALEFKATNQLTGFYCNSTSGDISGWDINIYGIVNS